MKIERKLMIGSLVLVVLPVIALAIYAAYGASVMARGALFASAEQQLILTRESQVRAVEDYFEVLQDTLHTQAQSPTVQQAMQLFASSFQHSEASSLDPGLKNYYESSFLQQFRTKNPSTGLSIKDLTDSLGAEARHWQQLYIADNPHPIGSKFLLDLASDGSVYSATHGRFHSYFRQLLESYGLYDLFLVEGSTGHVLYSVVKKLDFGTSLLTGPYVKSGLGEAFAKAAQLAPGETVLTQFKLYIPSYNDPAAFMATPVYSNGRRLGVLVFQMPLQHIADLVSFKGQWSQVGLGETGQALMFTADGVLLSEPRAIYEQGASAIERIQQADSTMVARIKANQSAVGSKLYEPLIKGAAAQGLVQNPFGQEVLLSMTEREFFGQNWVFLAEQTVQEVLRPMQVMLSDMIGFELIFGAFMMWGMVILAVRLFSRQVVKPIKILATQAHALGSSDQADLTQTLEVYHQDELADVTKGLNRFFSRIHDIVQDVRISTHSNEATLRGLDVLSLSTRKKADEQSERTAQLASSAAEMSASIGDVMHNLENASEGVKNARERTLETERLFVVARDTMITLADNVKFSSQEVGVLHDRSQDIGNILTVIREIAEQTNLLALNAAIEAARAGDQGRGFSVVADEVRKLAKRTHESTGEVDRIVASLQSQAEKTVHQMTQSSESATKSVESFYKAEDLLRQLVKSVNDVSDELFHVANAAEQQNKTATDVAENLTQLDQLSETVQAAFGMMHDSLVHLSLQSAELHQKVSVFHTANYDDRKSPETKATAAKV